MRTTRLVIGSGPNRIPNRREVVLTSFASGITLRRNISERIPAIQEVEWSAPQQVESVVYNMLFPQEECRFICLECGTMVLHDVARRPLVCDGCNEGTWNQAGTLYLITKKDDHFSERRAFFDATLIKHTQVPSFLRSLLSLRPRNTGLRHPGNP